MEFAGAGKALSSGGIEAAAKRLGVDAAHVWTILRVETRGWGYLADRRPQILFERHWFHKQTSGAFSARAPDLSSARAGGYGPGGAAQYQRLMRAIALDRRAALRSTSWGIGQVMGFHAESLGYPDVEAMVEGMVADEDEQLRAVAAFIVGKGLHRALQRQDWTTFAKGYNGSDFAKNRYDEKLRHEHDDLVANGLPDLRLRDAQMRLLFRGFDPGPIDGELGNLTRAALRRFQTQVGLPATGEPDEATLTRLET
ncbi:MAG TPA: N-acetylmuramidase domain-containing protein [Methylomirabilota bacterium]|jgi:hypothetical protein